MNVKKAFLLAFLCLLAVLVLPFTMSIPIGLHPVEFGAFANVAPTITPQGDPIGIPGGGGLR